MCLQFNIFKMGKKYLFEIGIAFVMAFGQLNGQTEFTDAFKMKELGLLDESLEAFVAAEKQGKFTSQSLATVANILHQKCKYKSAAEYYNRARILSPTDFTFCLDYARVLIRVGNIDAAKAELANLSPDAEVNQMMDYCDFALRSSKSLKAEKYLGGESADFGMTIFNKEQVYSTYNAPVMSTSALSIVKGTKGYHLAKYEDGLSRSFFNGISNKLNISSMTASNNGIVAYMRSSSLCETWSCRVKNASIVIGKWDGQAITEEIAFAHNQLGTSSIDPFITKDGSTIFFASNRPGGYGGFDIYTSSLVEGIWSEPKNLGDVVNSPGNEVSPILSNDVIIFASDWHLGYGGFDLFEYKMNGKVSHMMDLNTTGDDYYPSMVDGQLYYTSTVEEKSSIYMKMMSNASKTMLSSMVVKQNTPSARLVSTGYTVTKTNRMYYVQLAAFSSTRKDFEKFKSLVKFGDVYKVFVGQAVKVRLGMYSDESEARNILTNVKKNGYPDAFVIAEAVSPADLELIYGSDKVMPYAASTSNPPSKVDNSSVLSGAQYKVRLASYEDPIWFDNKKVKDIGQIEQWSKGTWTIFVLSGFKNYEEAELARIKANNRGFANAEVVLDNGGIMEPIKKN
jgi:hypothetical protein